MVRVGVQRGERNAAADQNPADDLPEAAEAGHDHRRLTVRRGLVLGAAVAGLGRRPEPLDQFQQQRRGGHGEGHHQVELGDHFRRQQVEGPGLGEQHEGEFAALAEQQPEPQGVAAAHLQRPGNAEQHQGLDPQQGRAHGQDRPRRRRQQAQVHGHADGDEEQPQQHALERLNIGVQLLPVGGVGEQHAGHEGAQTHGEMQGFHQLGGAEDQQQGGGGHQLPVVQPRQPAQPGVEQVAPGQPHQGQHQHAHQQVGLGGAGVAAGQHRQQQQ